MTSAPLLAHCSLPTQTGQAEMRPASILICIYPADDPAPFSLPSQAQITPIITLILTAHGVLSEN